MDSSNSSTPTKLVDDIWENSSPRVNSLECWDYSIELECLQGPQDLQLAAELGRTLLDRTKELESSLRQQQNICDDQKQEITYLTKQLTALREANESRVRLYEQLDVNIQELERANHCLVLENATEKKHNKTLTDRVEQLEVSCEDLMKTIDETKKLLQLERRKNERISRETTEQNGLTIDNISNNTDNKNFTYNKNSSNTIQSTASSLTHYDESSEPETDQAQRTTLNRSTSFKSCINSSTIDTSDTHSHFESYIIEKLQNELENSKKYCRFEEQKITELEEQLINYIHENQQLQEKLARINTIEEKSVYEELSILEEVRQGQMCQRCLRSIDDKASNTDNASINGIEEDDDDNSIMDLINQSESHNHMFGSHIQIKNDQKLDLNRDSHAPSPNPYRELVEKYEALLDVQRHPLNRNHRPAIITNDDLLTSGEFSSINTKYTDEDSNAGRTNNTTINNINNNHNNDNHNKNGVSMGARRKTNIRTPTDFSEAESASSGFSDETSNKATQTDERSGYFLCTIADGEDCKFSIYDDASPIDSRFRNRPEYRELFKEIFQVLKKAAENKEEGDKLPLLDDSHPLNVTVKAPPVTPATEELPDFCDDNQSVISSAVSEQSVAMSERITKTERKRIEGKKHEKNGQENKPPCGQPIMEDGRVLTPFKRQPLEYLSVSVNLKKKSKKNRNRNQNADRSDSPILPSPPRFYIASGGRKRRDMRPFNPLASSNATGQTTTSSAISQENAGAAGITPAAAVAGNTKFEWNGNSMTIYNRKMQSPTPNNNNKGFTMPGGFEFKPSAASQDLHRLKKLDLSYAEVLRRADQCRQLHHHQPPNTNHHHHHNHHRRM